MMESQGQDDTAAVTHEDANKESVFTIGQQQQQQQQKQQQEISDDQRGESFDNDKQKLVTLLVDDFSNKDEGQENLNTDSPNATDDNIAADAINTSTDTQPSLSKKQMKKRKRYQKLMDIKKRKKQQAKERRHAKAVAEGRDLEEERRLQLEREKSGEGKKRREEEWNKRMESAKTSFRVCIDCGFESLMTFKEINSLANQIRYCYAANKRSNNPVYISVSSLNESGTAFQQLSKVEGFPDQWKPRGFSCSSESLEKMHDIKNLVYLTSDSENTLEHLDDSKTYVIGGIVDRNRLKGTTIEKANEIGMETAKLPIDEHLKLVATKVLTVNHVFEILLKYRELGNDWKKALMEVLPQRKDITEVERENRVE